MHSYQSYKIGLALSFKKVICQKSMTCLDLRKIATSIGGQVVRNTIFNWTDLGYYQSVPKKNISTFLKTLIVCIRILKMEILNQFWKKFNQFENENFVIHFKPLIINV